MYVCEIFEIDLVTTGHIVITVFNCRNMYDCARYIMQLTFNFHWKIQIKIAAYSYSENIYKDVYEKRVREKKSTRKIITCKGKQAVVKQQHYERPNKLNWSLSSVCHFRNKQNKNAWDDDDGKKKKKRKEKNFPILFNFFISLDHNTMATF